MSETEKQFPTHYPEVAERMLAKRQHPWFTEHIIQPLAIEWWRTTKRHPNFWVEADYQEKLPGGAFIAAINHSHDDDIIASKVLLHGRSPMVPAKITLFENRLVGSLYSAMGALPLIRQEDNPDDMNWDSHIKPKLGQHLEAGNPLFIYPEGKRLPEVGMSRIRGGAVDVAVEYGFPVVPIGFANTHVKGSDIAAHVGDVIYPPDTEMPHARAVAAMNKELKFALPIAYYQSYELLASQTGQPLEELLSNETVV